jgi:hypothetical protein
MIYFIHKMLLQYDQMLKCGALRRGKFKIVLNGDCGNPSETFGSWESDQIASSTSSSSSFQGRSVDDDNDNNGGDKWELYDIDADPSETIELSSTFPDIFESLKVRLQRHGSTVSPALAYETHGDADADPSLHNGYWVPWLDSSTLTEVQNQN